MSNILNPLPISMPRELSIRTLRPVLGPRRKRAAGGGMGGSFVLRRSLEGEEEVGESILETSIDEGREDRLREFLK